MLNRFSRPVFVAVVLLLLVGVAAATLTAAERRTSLRAPLVPAAGLPGELTGPAPWPRNVEELRARLDALQLPALAQEGTVLHVHQHLDVFVNGRRVVVPAGIGIDGAERFISPLHTHDASGTIHVESPNVRVFTLGRFFGVWGVRFTPTCLGGYCAAGPKRLGLCRRGPRPWRPPAPAARRAPGDRRGLRHPGAAPATDPALLRLPVRSLREQLVVRPPPATDRTIVRTADPGRADAQGSLGEIEIAKGEPACAPRPCPCSSSPPPPR